MMTARHPHLKTGTRLVKVKLLALKCGPPQRFLTIPGGAKVYGPLRVRGEYAEFIWDGEKYECHVDEFVNDSAALDQVAGIGTIRQPALGHPIAERIPGGKKPSRKIEQLVGKRTRVVSCTEQRRLLDAFGETVQALLVLHEQQFMAIAEGDSEAHRFDLLIHMANERKQEAKYAYLQHVETHGCTTDDGIDKR